MLQLDKQAQASDKVSGLLLIQKFQNVATE